MGNMAASNTLGKRRTVRFSIEDDRRIEAFAHMVNKPVSEIIREKVIQSIPEGGKTASEWILDTAKTPAPQHRPDASRDAFRKAYTERHK